MKLSSIIVAASLVGSLVLGGCTSGDETKGAFDEKAAAPAVGEASSAVAPEENVAAAPVEDASQAPGIEKDERVFHYYAPHAPPAMRREIVGVAPSANHFWAPGYYRWNGREHVWYRGSWQARRPGFEYAGPTWVTVGGRHEYRPGRWYRR